MLGANREGKDIVKGKASRIQSSRLGSALVCVRRNAQYLELKLLEYTQFVLKTVVIVSGSTGYLVSPPLRMCARVSVPKQQRCRGVAGGVRPYEEIRRRTRQTESPLPNTLEHRPWENGRVVWLDHKLQPRKTSRLSIRGACRLTLTPP